MRWIFLSTAILIAIVSVVTGHAFSIEPDLFDAVGIMSVGFFVVLSKLDKPKK